MSKLTADHIFFGENIISMDQECPNPEAIAIKNTKIISIGRQEEVFSFSGPMTKHVLLAAKQTLLPGFIEPHHHAVQMVRFRCYGKSCKAQYKSYEEIKKLFEETLAQINPDTGEWCFFQGWDPEITDLPNLSADFLDDLSRDIPIFVASQNGHVFWVNHKALDVAGITNETPNPPGGTLVRDEVTNKLTGQLLEEPAAVMVFKHAPSVYLTRRKLDLAIDDQFKSYTSHGFTTVTDLCYVPDIDKAICTVLFEKTASKECPVRLALYKLVRGPGTQSQSEKKVEDTSQEVDFQKQNEVEDSFLNGDNEKLWIAGVKIIADGSPHCGTSATREAYLENDLTKILGFPSGPCCGKLNYSSEKLYETVKYWHGRVKQIAVHAHGERSIDQVLNVYEKVLNEVPTSDHRYRIEHLGLGEEHHMVRAAKLNLALSFFVAQLYFYARSFSRCIFGEERTRRWSPVSLASKHGLRWTIHQDHPFFPGDPQPFANMKTAVTRTQRDDPNTVYGREYCVSIEEALKAYTINAAWQIHKDEELGSLTVGKKADLVILTENPLTTDPFQLEDIRVIDTYVDGRSNNLSEKRESKKDGKTIISYIGFAEGTNE